MALSPDRYVLTHAPGLCWHGCGEPLARTRNRFINGHDAKLLDLLLDAHRDGSVIVVQPPARLVSPAALAEVGVEYTPAEWARAAFFAKGYRWFQLKAGLADPAYDELPGVEDPIASHLDLGAPTAPSRAAQPSLEEDLTLVRDLVARASSEPSGSTEALLAALERVRRLEADLAEATRPITVEQSQLAALSDRDVLAMMAQRGRRAAELLKRSRYDGDADELWDLLSMFNPQHAGAVRVRAARVLLGQEEV